MMTNTRILYVSHSVLLAFFVFTLVLHLPEESAPCCLEHRFVLCYIGKKVGLFITRFGSFMAKLDCAPVVDSRSS